MAVAHMGQRVGASKHCGKELVPIAAACSIRGPLWQSEHVLVRCDN